ncbi:hypothetical protein CDAR_90291 [Caerostris darwini]|uniref:Uncharacterized protein n=1 Tax=Caerostris darwini TaxID=1538125 RepID=A0AAV4NRZ5_9ARAC|nr:hypothetical protein CDAR_90291 [Caerostris darwini]
MAWAVIDEALPINNSLPQEQAPNLLFLEGILLRRPGIFFPFHLVFFFPSFPSQIQCEGKGKYITREEMESHFSTHLTVIARGKRGLDEGEKNKVSDSPNFYFDSPNLLSPDLRICSVLVNFEIKIQFLFEE